MVQQHGAKLHERPEGIGHQSAKPSLCRSIVKKSDISLHQYISVGGKHSQTGICDPLGPRIPNTPQSVVVESGLVILQQRFLTKMEYLVESIFPSFH